MTDPNVTERDDVLQRPTLRVNGAGDQFDAGRVCTFDVEWDENRCTFVVNDHVFTSTGATAQQEVVG